MPEYLIQLLCAVPLAALLWLAATGPALAWGAGHVDQTRAVFERLPRAIRSSFSRAIVEQAVQSDSEYPDSPDPFDANRIGADAVARLAAHGIKTREGLHSDEGRAVAFLLLVDAFRERRYDRAALWIASLSHSTGDMAAANHDPLAHVYTYAYGASYNLCLPGGVPVKTMEPLLDLHWTAQDPAGAKVFARRLDAMKIADDGRGAAEALVTIMMYGCTGSQYLGPRGAPIVADAAAVAASGERAARQRLLETMADLGAWAAVRVVRDAAVAYRLAQCGVPIELTEADLAEYRRQRDALIRTKPLADEALFRPILCSLTDAGLPVTGVVLEPCWRQDDAVLGYRDKLAAAAIGDWLSKTGRAYATLDIRDALAHGFPDPKRMPAVVISASELRDYAWMRVRDLDQHLHDYVAAGGRVLWIGAAPPPPALGPLGKAMASSASGSWPLPLVEFLKRRIQLIGVPDALWSFTRSPQTDAGWQRPYDPYHFEPADGIRPLVTLNGGPEDSPLVVGAVWEREGKKRAVFLPSYLVSPLLLTKADVIAHPVQPQLDAINARVLQYALDLLGQ